MAAENRGIISGLVDRLVGWFHSLPPERCNYTVTKLRIPVADNISLAAYLYLPTGFKPLGTILVRTPYGIDFPSSLTLRIFAARGYQVLASSCRGTSGSDGTFESIRYEFDDGQATFVWMRVQPWYTGSFATMGPSYLGYVQWALLADRPPDMKTAIIKTGPIDFSDFVWGTGALSSNIIAWADTTSRMNRGDRFISIILSIRSQRARLRPIYDSVPLLDAVDRYFDGKAPDWLREKLKCPDRSDELWKPLQQYYALQKADIPIMLTTGWNDIILRNVMEQYATLAKRGCNVALTIGPWTHLDAGGPKTAPETLAWLDHHLADRPEENPRSPVRVFITGRQEWRDLPRWPSTSSPLDLFLAPESKLNREPTSHTQSESSFTFDPKDPTPDVAIPLLFDNGPGRSESDSSLAKRSDVLAFTTEPLDQDLEVCGAPSVELHYSTSSPNADLLVLLSDVSANGTSKSITEYYLRLPQDRDQGPLNLTLTDCGHLFRKGNRIRLMIAGGSHPRYIRNLGTGGDPVCSSDLQSVKHTVQHAASAISKLTLPVMK